MPGPEVNPKTIRTAVGRAFYNARVMLDVSQSEVARAAEINHGTYNKFEQGINVPSHATSDKLSYAFGKPVNEIVFEQEQLEGIVKPRSVEELMAENEALREEVRVLREYIGIESPNVTP